MSSNPPLKAGMMLLAQPFMDDHNFARAAVLIVDHHPTEGTVGFILNQKLDITIDDLVEGFPEIKAPVHIGGPVARDTFHYIHDVGDILEDSLAVSHKVFWGGNYTKLRFLIEQELIKPRNIRFYLGYSGWSAGQLQKEIDAGSWMIADMDPNYIFSSDEQQLWQQITTDKGGAYKIIGQIPKFNFNN